MAHDTYKYSIHGTYQATNITGGHIAADTESCGLPQWKFRSLTNTIPI